MAISSDARFLGLPEWPHYNSADLPRSETLTIDGRTYAVGNTYDNNERLTEKVFPSGNTYSFSSVMDASVVPLVSYRTSYCLVLSGLGGPRPAGI